MNLKFKKAMSVLLTVVIVLSGIMFVQSDNVVLAGTTVKGEEEQTDILFIGNSMTYYNTLCNVVQGIATLKGHNVKCSAATNGGQNLIYQSTADNVLNAIKKGGYEIVVLQDIVGSFHGDNLMKGATAIIPIIKQYNPNAQIVFYEPWPLKGSLTGTNSLLPYFTSNYIDVARKYGALLAPAGETFYDVYVNEGYDYYCGDEKHPQPLGTFVSASTIYYTIYGDELYSDFTSANQSYLDNLINTNVAYTSEGKRDTYSLEILNSIFSKGYQYAHAVKAAVADATGKTDYTSAAKIYSDPNDKTSADLTEIPEISLRNAEIINVSSTINGTNTAEKMIDGNYNTRWESKYEDPQYFTIVLDRQYKMEGIKLYWETAASKKYVIETSSDNQNWSTVFEQKNGLGGKNNGDSNRSAGLESIKFENVTTAKYIRFYSTERNTGYGVSIYELKLFGTEADKVMPEPEVPIEPETSAKPEMPQITEGENIAKGKTAVSSGNEGNHVAAKYAVDGSKNTRWSSDFGDDNAWIYVDLGEDYYVDQVALIWEAAYGKAYEIQVSTDTINWTTVKQMTNQDGGEDVIEFDIVKARYIKMSGIKRAIGYGYSLWEFEVYEASEKFNNPEVSGKDVAAKGVTEQSGSETTGMSAKYAVDSNKGTRWSSDFNDDAWMIVDLGKIYAINEVIITWENAYGKAYEIQTSTDGVHWTTVKELKNQDGGEDVIKFNTVKAKYVKMQGITRALGYGYSIWDFQVIAV